MPTSNLPLSETSPLLGPESDGVVPKAVNGSIVNGIVPNGAAEIGADVERHDSIDAGRAAQFEGRPEIRKQLKYILPAISIGVFLSAADQTIIVSSYGTIGSDLGALNLTSWIATSYFLTLSSFQPLYGKLSDIFGRKACLLWAYLIFGLGGLFCGLAQDINQLIAARAFQGIGGGGMTTVVSILMSDIIPLKDRGLWQGLINIIYATGAGCGAPLGGILADFVGWRWAFLGQAPICLLAFVAVVFALKLPAGEQKDWQTNLRRIDFLGALVLVSAVFCLIFGLDRGSNESWTKPVSYGPLIASVFAFTILAFVERNIAAEPFAPTRVIFERSLFSCYMCNFFGFGSWLAIQYYIPLFFQAVDGLGATGAAVRLIPAVVAGVSGSLIGGIIMKRTGKYYWLTLTAYIMLTIGAVIIVCFVGLVTDSTYGIIAGMIFCGFGNGIGVTSTLIGLLSNAAPDDQAITTAGSYLFRSLGSVVGVSLTSSIIQQSLRGNLREALGSGKEGDRVIRKVRRSLDAIKGLDPKVAQVVRDCYEHAIINGFALMVGVAFLTVVSSVFIREKRLSR